MMGSSDTLEPRPAPRMPRFPRSLLVLAVVLGLGGFTGVVRVPYHWLGPGPTTDVLSMITVSGADTHPSQGKLLLTTASVSAEPLTLWGVLYAWVRPDLSVTPRSAFVHPGLSDRQQDARNTFDMEQSKLSAELAAFEVLGLEVVRIRGARVVSVVDDAPADGKLRAGDTIVAVDGEEVRTRQEAGAKIRARAIGDEVSLTVLRGGARRTVVIATRGSVGDPGTPSVGVFLGEAYRLPADIEIDTERIGGPSGGLVFALAIVDALTPGDLTGGRVVAATGTIDRGEDGEPTIGIIGAVPEKVRGAEAAGATVFIVPEAEREDAARHAPPGMTVIGVRTLREAIRALEQLPPASSEGAG